MFINRTNFFSLLPQITQIIKSSHFISLDLEMSGLVKGETFANSQLDSVQEKYWKLKENVGSFLPIQLGLCAFSVEENKIKAFPMSFYLYPYSLFDSLDKVFKFEQSATEFLMSHNFDFNKLFYEGVYFISKENEENFKIIQEQKHVKKTMLQNSFIPTPDMMTFCAIHEENIKAFMENPACYDQTFPISIKFMKFRVYKYFEDFLLKKYKNLIEITYDSEFFMNRSYMLIRKMPLGENAESNSIIDKPKIEKELEGPMCGVRAIFDIICKNKTPLVVHNGIYDILQIFDKMIKTLPDLYLLFCQEISSTFGTIYDTKFILHSSSFMSGKLLNNKSDLSSAFNSLVSAGKKENFPNIEIEKFDNQEDFIIKPHDAMSDAYMTGFIFLRSMSFLSILKVGIFLQYSIRVVI